MLLIHYRFLQLQSKILFSAENITHSYRKITSLRHSKGQARLQSASLKRCRTFTEIKLKTGNEILYGQKWTLCYSMFVSARALVF